MFGKVKCSHCKTKVREKDAAHVKLETANGLHLVYYCQKCADLLESTLKVYGDSI